MVDDIGEEMDCSDHPNRNNPGGICAYCLQEKLDKLVSSSNPSEPFFPSRHPLSSPSSFSPTSFPSSDLSVSASFSVSTKPHRSKKKSANSTAVRLQKFAATKPNAGDIVDASYRTRKKSFWSFLTLSYTSFAFSTALPPSIITKRRSTSSAASSAAGALKGRNRTPRREQDKPPASSAAAIGDDDISPRGSQVSSTFERKVARSRSVGCGSRRFSGDFLERISYGLGDCALRRVESQREAKLKTSINRRERHGDVVYEEQGIKEQIKDSLSTISSSACWLHAASVIDALNDRSPAKRGGGTLHGLSKSWAWAFTSPIRVFRPIRKGGQTAIMAAGSASHGGRSGGVNHSMAVV